MANKASGFILIYVASLLAAIAVILLEVGRAQSPSPLFMEKQLAHLLQHREQQVLLDFVTAGTQEQKLQVDPRFLQFKRIVAANPKRLSEMEEELAWLKAALGQLNFKIDAAIGKEEHGVNGKTDAATEKMSASEARETFFQPRKAAYAIKLGDVDYAIRLLPGDALPNLNAIPFDALWRYLSLLEIPENEAKQLAAALIDWRDEDGLRTQAIGAESEYYYGMSPPYSPPNAPMRSWQELNYVRGMTPERVRLLRENFMLGPPGANGLALDFAPPAAFAAMTGLKLETVRNIMMEYGKLGDKNTGVGTVLLSQDAAAFDKAVSWGAAPPLLRIQIASPDSLLTADYDTKNRRIISWW